MSAVEVIEQIKLLPREEQEQVVSFVHTLEKKGDAGESGKGVSEDFQRAADEVFTTNAGLFRKLAQ